MDIEVRDEFANWPDKKWRPKDWDELMVETLMPNGYIYDCFYKPQEAFEAGADAMLEVLKSGTSWGFDEFGHLKVGLKGYLVFIPDKE